MDIRRNNPPPEPPLGKADAYTADLARALPLGDLLALGGHTSAEITPEALLQEVADAIHMVLGYPQVCVRLRNADTDDLEACAYAGIPSEQIAKLKHKATAPAYYQALFQARFRYNGLYHIPAPFGEEDMIALSHDHADLVGDGVLLVPLRGRGERLIGAIYVQPERVGGLDPARLQLLEVLGRQASLALENARLAGRAARLLAKEQLLAELGRDVGNTLDLDIILARTVERLGLAFHGGSVALLNSAGELEIVAAIGHIDSEARHVRLGVGQGICGWVAQHGLPFLSNDTLNEHRIEPAASDIGTNRFIRSYIAVPLRSGGQIIGTLNVESDQVHAFTYEDVDLLEAVAAQIGGPIASARLYQEGQHLAEQVARRNEQLTVLNAIARIAVSTLDLERILTAVTAQIQQGFGYWHVEMYTVDEELQELQLVAQAGKLAHINDHRQPIHEGALGQAFNSGQPVRVDDVQLQPDLMRYSMEETRAALCVPIRVSGRVLALLNLESRHVAAFTQEDMAVLKTAADVLASAIENARLYQRAQEAAVLEERSRIARDLHDSISQQLFSMTLTAQAARTQVEKNPARAASQLERLQETANAALKEMRSLIFQLRPPALNEQGLVAALKQHVDGLQHREGLTINLRISGEERNTRGVEQTIYRIVQEALNNVVRHAGACAVDVELDAQPYEITLRIADDGRGFDIQQAAQGGGRHLGLISMRERAAELSGILTMRSQPGQGTELLLRVPGRQQNNT
ncbi:GAF domain-containing protein [Chloroflexia bacterium SDU3-3]|nr:GAF domain-containing protein [Chloroflexia bacterium SDU3-3]